MARATGCSDPASAAAPKASTWCGAEPSTSSTCILPRVMVPVLSNTIVSTVRVDSRISGPLITMPSFAARPEPTNRAVGVASPNAHGQAITSTDTAAVKAAPTLPVTSSHPIRVRAEMPSTVGTNTEEILSASRCTGALPACAWVTRRAIWDRVVSSPTRVACTVRAPEVLMVAPVTASPGSTSTGTDSPVKRDASMALCPSWTMPSVATFSPGRTRNRSPSERVEAGTCLVVRAPESEIEIRVASLAPIVRMERSASPALWRALASAQRPPSRNVVTMVAASK